MSSLGVIVDGQWVPFIAGGDQEVYAPEGSEYDQGGGGEPGGHKPDTQFIPKHRFDEVNNKLKENQRALDSWKKLGNDPEAVRQELERQRKLSGDRTLTEDEAANLEKELRQIPRFSKMFDRFDQMEQREQESRKTFQTRAENKVGEFVKELGVEPKDDTERQKVNLRIQGLIAEEIRMDPELIARYQDRDPAVIQDAWDRVKGLLGAGRLAKNARKQEVKAPVGGRPQAKPPATAHKEKTDDELEDREILARASDKGFSILESRMEE